MKVSHKYFKQVNRLQVTQPTFISEFVLDFWEADLCNELKTCIIIYRNGSFVTDAYHIHCTGQGLLST